MQIRQHNPKRTPLLEQLTQSIQGEYDYNRPRRGEIREAVVLAIGENDVIVDLGAKRDGIVPYHDLEHLDEKYRASLQVGDRVPVAVLRSSRDQDGIRVSINKGLQQQDWLRAKEYLDSTEVFQGEVVGLNRGGIVVPFGRLRGFVPNSHLTSIPHRVAALELNNLKSKLLGQVLWLTVLEVEQQRRRLILSERVARRLRRRDLWQEITPGDVRTGTVVNVVDYGAFLDIGGIDGLLHISELDWVHVGHPGEILSIGDEVEVYVLDIDRERRRISLSRKRLLPDPWHEIADNLEIGQFAEGTVTNTVDFGAFVDLGKGVEGMIHVSEMPKGELALSEIRPGLSLIVRILDIDLDRRRIALSLQDVPGRNPEQLGWLAENTYL